LEGQEWSSWRDQILEEAWLDDWQRATELFLLVKLPPTIEGEVILGLKEGPAKSENAVIRNQRARFDLLAFQDALRAGPPVRNIIAKLSGPAGAMDEAQLLSVRNRWVAENIECTQTVRRPKIFLEVSWEEKGKADNKTIRLWRMTTGSFRPVIVHSAEKHDRHVTLEADRLELLPGKYLLQLESEDPWSKAAPIHPGRGALNTVEIQILSPVDLRQDEILSLQSVADIDSRNPPYMLDPAMYRIRIVGKIVHNKLPSGLWTKVQVFKNEGWFVGVFELTNDPEINAELGGAHPVKLEYSRSENIVTAIEDREGDGAMYCRICRRLYWRQSALQAEQEREHKPPLLVGPELRFAVCWEPPGE
jgi:hypothetical protein